MPFVMGTAGHIDHGKTSLVRALTGQTDARRLDRLSEEKRRGITIELGFAALDIPSGAGAVRIGVVDVPGHERFVRTMVAGAAGIDFALLVVAADEGVMPQTREHLDICSLLGIRHGLIALTKIDAVDADMLALARDDAEALARGTFLEGAPIVPVSALTGEGMEDLRRGIAELVASLEEPARSDVFRLPVDRVFTLKGHGTVAAGTAFSGAVALGDDVRVMPRNLPARVRGIQSHGDELESSGAGRRLSLNLGGVDVADVERGDVIAHPGTLFPAKRWIAALTCLPSAPRALRHRAEVHFHHGAREVAARLYFYDRDRLAPGETALAEIRFAAPLVGMFGDRCVVRAFSPLRAVAGGDVLLPVETPLRRRDMTPELQARLLGLQTADEDERVALQLELAGASGADAARLAVLTSLPARRLDKILRRLSGAGRAHGWDKENNVWISAAAFDALRHSALERAAAFHAREPLLPGMPKGVLFGGDTPSKLAHAALQDLLRGGALIAEGETLRLPEHRVALASAQQDAREGLLAAYRNAGFTPPNLKDALDGLGLSAKEAAPLLRVLQTEKALVKVAEGLYFSAPVVEEIRERVRQWFQDHAAMSPADFKDITGGLSRKYVIPLLEYFDKERLTMRVGEQRQWRGKM